MDKAARRQQLLEVARDVFSKRGYHAAKVEDIVAAAGVARGTFYLYFEDKRAIFAEIVDRMLTRVGMTITRVDVKQPVPPQVADNIRRIVALLREDRATTVILLTTATGVDPAFDRKIRSFYDEVYALLEESLTDGHELGIVVKGDARMQATFVLGALKEVLLQVAVEGRDWDEQRIVSELYAFLEHGLLRMP
jgi:AcrR family transcriptional regulator